MTGDEFVGYVRMRVKAVGLKNPYIVGCMEPRDSFIHAKILKVEGYDAVMDYEGAYGGAVAKRDEAGTYAAATERDSQYMRARVSQQRTAVFAPLS